jgi:hypothetical protein
VGSYDGKFMSLYVDGKLIATSAAQSGSILYPSSGSFTIGAYIDSSQSAANVLNGMLADVAVWDYSFGPEAVTLMYGNQRNTSFFICSECPAGTISNGKCQGNSKTDCQTAYPCPTCKVGERMSAPCEEPGSLVQISCVPCSASCAKNQRIVASSTCSGKGWSNIECVDCKSACGQDEWVASACDGTGFLDTECKACKACGQNQYISLACDGKAGKDISQCSNCTSVCNFGEVLEGASCDGTQKLDTVHCKICLPGTYAPSRNSTACLDCPEGFYSDSNGASACNACGTGTYSARASTACTACSDWPCQDGEWRTVCTGSQNGTCSASPAWTRLYPVGSQLLKIMNHGTALLPDGSMYIFGGEVASGNARTDALHLVALANTSVPSVTSIMKPHYGGASAPSARSCHAMASFEYEVYVSGGFVTGSSPVDDFWVLTRPGNWSQRISANLPRRMARHKMTSTPSGLLWLFGGQGSQGQALGKLYSMSVKSSTQAWKEHASNATKVPQPRRDFGMVSLGHRIFVSIGFFFLDY